MTQHKMKETPSKFKLSITNGMQTVEAPLPEDFGFTVGSEYTTPFDVGSVSGALQKLYAIGGISAPVGLRMRKMYANPEPTEISFDMEFNAHYSAKEEVAMPIITLMMMGLGRVVRMEDVEQAITKMSALAAKGASLFGFGSDGEAAIGDVTNSVQQTVAAENRETSSRILDMISLISAPNLVEISFGDFIRIDKAYITSTACSFSNRIDVDGYPMSGKVSVTATLQLAPLADDISNFFGGLVGVSR